MNLMHVFLGWSHMVALHEQPSVLLQELRAQGGQCGQRFGLSGVTVVAQTGRRNGCTARTCLWQHVPHVPLLSVSRLIVTGVLDARTEARCGCQSQSYTSTERFHTCATLILHKPFPDKSRKMVLVTPGRLCAGEMVLRCFAPQAASEAVPGSPAVTRACPSTWGRL